MLDEKRIRITEDGNVGIGTPPLIPRQEPLYINSEPFMLPSEILDQRESVRVLEECKELQIKKGNDYQNSKSVVKQADYYPNGCMTILDIIHAKSLRLRSVMEAMANDPEYQPNFESLEDSFKDLINYASFGVAYCRGKVEGQNPEHDFLNRPKG